MLLRSQLGVMGVTDVDVSSAGTHARNGKPIDPRVQEVLLEWGIDSGKHSARRMEPRIAREADAVIAMDDLNLAELVATYPDIKSRLFLLAAVRGGDPAAEIPDPYYGDPAAVRRTLELIRADVFCLASLIAASRGGRQ